MAPSSLVQNWAKEVTKWLGKSRLDPEVVQGDRREVEDRLAAFRNGYKQLLIVSYDLCRNNARVLQACRCDLLVCDEGHRLKNGSIKIVAALSQIPCDRRVIISGTPLQNDLNELYSIVNFVNPGLLGTRDAFRNLYADCITRSREPGAPDRERALGKARQEELSRRTQPFMLRRTAALLSCRLPPKTECLVFVRMGPLQTALYRHFLTSKALRSVLSDSTAGMAAALTCITTLRKVLMHPHLIYLRIRELATTAGTAAGAPDSAGPAERDADAEWVDAAGLFPPDYDPKVCDPGLSSKLQLLQLLLHETRAGTRDKVVIVSNSTQTLDLVQALLQDRYPLLRLDGATLGRRRMDVVDRFNDPRGNVFALLLSSKAGGVGLNLVGANRLVLLDPDWNPSNDLQAMARVWREGQSRPVFIYRLFTTGTIEEKILQRQYTKDGLSKQVC